MGIGAYVWPYGLAFAGRAASGRLGMGALGDPAALFDAKSISGSRCRVSAHRAGSCVYRA